MLKPFTRAEHLQWCKDRALRYLPDYPEQAFTSMASDLDKHDETRGHGAISIGLMMLLAGHFKHPEQMREFINGFN